MLGPASQGIIEPPGRNLHAKIPTFPIIATMALSLLAPVTASFHGIAPALTPARSQAARMQYGAPPPQQFGGPPQQGFNVRDMPGVSGPIGFFDPLEFSKDASEGKVKFYREVELKHGRVAMLASLGFLVGEQFHPLFGGDINVPSVIAFQETPLQSVWPAVLFVISIAEVFSVFTFNSPFGGEMWSVRSDYASGDLGFDPMGLKPNNPSELKEMQTKEINNGRLAMIAIAGMVGQELATGNKLF